MFTGRFTFHDTFTIRIIRTAVENAKASALFAHGAPFARCAFDAGIAHLFGFLVFLDEFTFWVTITRNERSKFSLARHEHTVCAERALFSGHFRTFHFLAIYHACTRAIGKTYAT